MDSGHVMMGAFLNAMATSGSACMEIGYQKAGVARCQEEKALTPVLIGSAASGTMASLTEMALRHVSIGATLYVRAKDGFARRETGYPKVPAKILAP